MKKLQLLLVIVSCVAITHAQTIDLETKTSVLLNDNTEVILYGKLRDTNNKNSNTVLNNEFYYLPPANSLRLTKSKNGENQFTFIKYAGNTDKLAMGGVLYFTMEFGLTKQQELELQQKLQQKYANAKVRGSVELMPQVGKPSGEFNVMLIKTDGSTSTLAKSSAPIGQGGKLAVMANLNRVDTEVIEEILKGKSGLGGVYTELRYTYPVRVPGFIGSLEFNQEKFQSLKDSFSRKSRQGGWHPGQMFGDSRHHSIEDIRKFYNYLEDNKVITANTERSQYIDKESAKELEKAFFNYFFETFAAPSELETQNRRSSAIDSISASKEGYKENFDLIINESTINNLNMYAKHDINHRVFHRFSCGFSDDIKTVLEDIDIDKHIIKVDLDDPFFAQRVITVGVDGPLSDLIGEYINGINVRLRKKKKDGSYYYFEDQAPINFLTKGDAAKIMTYNASHDQGSSKDSYDYMTTINYSGGKIEKSNWKPISSDQIFITSKLVPKEITFQADPAELKKNGIVRAYLQLQYKQQGKSKTADMNVSATGSNDTASKILFMDADKKAYAIRVIYFTKQNKQIIVPWQDNDFTVPFVYASIPEQLKGMSSDMVDAYNDKHRFQYKETRDIQNPDGTLKKEVKSEAAAVFGNN